MTDLPSRPTDRSHDQQPQPGADSFRTPTGGLENEELGGVAGESATTPGLEVGGGVAPGDTPPAAGSESQASEDRQKTPNQGPSNPSRLPNILGLTALAILVIGVIGYAIANVIAYIVK